jgi:hypothetical protein
MDEDFRGDEEPMPMEEEPPLGMEPSPLRGDDMPLQEAADISLNISIASEDSKAGEEEEEHAIKGPKKQRKVRPLPPGALPLQLMFRR